MLTERDLWRAMTCAAESRRAREKGHIPGPVHWVDELIDALRSAREELARSRQPGEGDLLKSNDDEDTDWLTSREVSEMLGWPLRTVQRHADKLGAISNGRRYFFPASAIHEHVEGRCA